MGGDKKVMVVQEWRSLLAVPETLNRGLFKRSSSYLQAFYNSYDKVSKGGCILVFHFCKELIQE